LAGTNGAGKSSIGGAMILRQRKEYFNPDEAAKRVIAADPTATQEQANSSGWHEGRRLLERAIEERLNFAFETTLGGNTIVALLEKALSEGLKVRVWYVGLNGPELHIARVRARVARGGHDIPEARIRERFDQSRLNLIRLLPKLTEVIVYDNSVDADLHAGVVPKPLLIIHLVQGRIKSSCDPAQIPSWAKPIWMAAMKFSRVN
jgi:predicted ABC-type ATPase